MRLFTLRGPVIRMPWPLVILGWLARLLAVILLRVLLFARRHPDVTALAAAVAVTGWAVARHGWQAPTVVLGVLLAVLWLWAVSDPPGFDRWVETPVRSRWRRQLVYRREWQPAMVVNSLDRAGVLPVLRGVTSTAVLDVVRVGILPGQTLDDWRKAAPRLAAAFGVRVVKPRKVPGRPHDLELWVRRTVRVAAGTRPVPELDDDEQPASGGAFRRDR